MKLSKYTLIAVLWGGSILGRAQPVPQLNIISRCIQYFTGKIWDNDTKPRVVREAFIDHDVYLLQLENNDAIIFKTPNYRTAPRKEVGAYRLDQMLGLGVVPETTYRVRYGKTGSAQRYIEKKKKVVENKQLDPKITYLDFLVANFDRRNLNLKEKENWPIEEIQARNVVVEDLGKDEKQWAIDFGFAKLHVAENEPEIRLILERAKHHPESIFPGKEVTQRFEALTADDWENAVGSDFTIDEILFIVRQNRKLSEIFRAKGLIP